MKGKNNKELIEHMVDTLREHSAPYKEGAWERFAASQHQGKKISPIWYWGSAAAMVLLGVTLLINNYLFDKGGIIVQNEYTQAKPESNNTDTEGGYPLDAEPDDQSKEGESRQPKSTMLAFTPTRRSQNQGLAPLQTATATISLKGEDHQLPVMSALNVPKAVSQETETDASTKQKEQIAANDKEMSKEEALIRMLNEGSSYVSSAQKTLPQRPEIDARKWNVGVMLSPSLTDERVNIGGGVTVAYQLSKKVSIGSGVSLVDLGFRQSSPNIPGGGVMDAPAPASLSNESPMFNARSLETKELTSINTNLLALDIPIDIKYQVSKQFYASAGVSFFTVLNENRTNNFLTRTPTDRTLQSADGFAFSQPEFQVKSVSEKASETPYQGNGYSGFLNFSVGRKMPISNKVGIAVEPFIKIPVGSLSNQDMNLRYGGLRVITSF